MLRIFLQAEDGIRDAQESRGQKTAYEMLRSLVGSEMCIRDRGERLELGHVAVHRLPAPVVELCDPVVLDLALAGEPELLFDRELDRQAVTAVSYTHLRAHETPEHLVC